MQLTEQETKLIEDLVSFARQHNTIGVCNSAMQFLGSFIEEADLTVADESFVRSGIEEVIKALDDNMGVWHMTEETNKLLRQVL